MKIILSVPGHLKTVPMNRYVYETLQDMGHEVKVFNYGIVGLCSKVLKKISRDMVYRNMNNRLKKVSDSFRPDLFFSIFGFDHDADVLAYIRGKGIVTACWWLNDPFQVKRSLGQALNYDYYFTNCKYTLDEYTAQGIKAAFLPVGAFPKVHKRLESHKRPHDICFAGDWGPMREKMLLSLAKDFRLSIWGPWGKKLSKDSVLRDCIVKDGFFTPEEMVQMFNSSKIVLNLHSWFGNWDYGVNPRLFEANGCGAFQLSDFKREIPDLYVPEKEIALYSDFDDLKLKAKYYLSNEKDRQAVADAGLARTMKEHTYRHRMEEMLYTMKLL